MDEQRIGIGIDMHRFAEAAVDGEQLVLGGVVFPGERALVGHSDADALAHAVADAILGAAGLGDLGSYFPDTDPAFSGADSLSLLAICVERVGAAGWHLVNADCTVITEAPKIAPLREEMIRALSRAAGGPVHVKATRPERLGSLGRIEGIACLAIALIAR